MEQKNVTILTLYPPNGIFRYAWDNASDLKKSKNEAPPLTTPLDITITEEGKNKVVQIKAIIHTEI